MAAAWMSVRSYLDNVIEVVSIKSGLILTYQEACDLLKERYDDWYLDTSETDGMMRIRLEDFEEQVNYLRYRLGNITEQLQTPFGYSKHLAKWLHTDYDPIVALKIILDHGTKNTGQPADPSEAVNDLLQHGFPPELVSDVIQAIIKMQTHSIYISYGGPTVGWWNSFTKPFYLRNPRE